MLKWNQHIPQEGWDSDDSANHDGKCFAKTLQNQANIFWKAYAEKRFGMTCLGRVDNKTISS